MLNLLDIELTAFIIWGLKFLKKVGQWLLFFTLLSTVTLHPHQPLFKYPSLCSSSLLTLQIEKKNFPFPSTSCLSLLPLGRASGGGEAEERVGGSDAECPSPGTQLLPSLYIGASLTLARPRRQPHCSLHLPTEACQGTRAGLSTETFQSCLCQFSFSNCPFPSCKALWSIVKLYRKGSAAYGCKAVCWI